MCDAVFRATSFTEYDSIFTEGTDGFTEEEINSIRDKEQGWALCFLDESKRALDNGWITTNDFNRRRSTCGNTLRSNFLRTLEQDSIDRIIAVKKGFPE